MDQTLDLNDLLILENELKVMLSISSNTKLHYSKISKERYDFAKSLYLYEGAKIREVKRGNLSGQLTYYLLNRIDNIWWRTSSNSIAEDAIKEFELESTPEISKVITNIIGIMREIGSNSNVILLIAMLTKGMEDNKVRQKDESRDENSGLLSSFGLITK